MDDDTRARSHRGVTTDAFFAPAAPGGRPLPVSGVVLAAGQSTRMGRDKALLEIAGRSLWQRQRGVLADAGARELFLSARPEQSWAKHAAGFNAVVHDAAPSCGPISGITAALERASHPHLAVLAIDLPKMTPSWLSLLLSECGVGVGAVGKRGDFYEPLAAIYPREVMPLAWEALAGGKYSLQMLLARSVGEGLMRVREISAADEALFANWNEPKAP